jgi:hypothetical protein
MMRLGARPICHQAGQSQAPQLESGEWGGPSGGSCAKSRNLKTKCRERKNFEKDVPNRVFEVDKRRESAGDSRAFFSAFGLSFKALPADFLRVVRKTTLYRRHVIFSEATLPVST